MRKVLIGAALLLGACGDPETSDKRGYTKAPLEEPNVLVRGETRGDMDRLGNPSLPEAPIFEAEEPAEEEKKPAPAATPAAPKVALPPGATEADVQAGQTLFTSTGNCFTCHAQNGAGTGIGPALNDKEWLNIDGSFASIQQVVKAGVAQPKKFPAPMPPMGGASLTDAQLKQVAAYVYTLSH